MRFSLSFFFSAAVACGILVLSPGIEPLPPEVEAQNLNHWTTMEAQDHVLLTGVSLRLNSLILHSFLI